MSRLGPECCCQRPQRPQQCCCDVTTCTTKRCTSRRNSATDTVDARRGTCLIDDQSADYSRKGSTAAQDEEEFNVSYFGKLGDQAYMLDLGASDTALSPSEQLQALAEQRGGIFKQQHVWGSPLSIGLCHVDLIKNSTADDASLEVVDEFETAGGISRSYSRLSSGYSSYNSSGHYSSTRSRRSGTLSRVSHTSGPKQNCPDPMLGSTTSLAATSMGSPTLSDAAQPYKGGIQLDHLQAEWSPRLANLLLAVKR